MIHLASHRHVTPSPSLTNPTSAFIIRARGSRTVAAGVVVRFDVTLLAHNLEEVGDAQDAQTATQRRPAPFAILTGPSGSGKTTLLRVLAGLDLPDLPHPREPLDAPNAAEPADILMTPRVAGMVFQESACFPHLTVQQNIIYGLGNLSFSRRELRAAHLRRLLGLDRLASTCCSALSGGERQRVALARSLAPVPQLLLLDEPLSSLDATTRTAVRRGLAQELAELAIPAILVTHEPSDAADFPHAHHWHATRSGDICTITS